jgi:hypothetical protein
MKKIYEFNEYKLATTITDLELMEMANISPKKTGVKDVYIWFGPNLYSHGRRIKISNIPNKFSKDDCFTLTIPKFQIIGDVNDKLITTSILNDIKIFVNLNIKLIEDFSDEKISTDDFVDNLKSIEQI